MQTYERFVEEKEELMLLMKKYNSEREKIGLDKLVEYRENISFNYGKICEGVLADLRYEHEMAVIDRKIGEKKKFEEIKDELNGARGSVGQAEVKSLIDSEQLYRDEALANKYYQHARGFQDGVKEFLNAIAGRIHMLKDNG